MDFSINAGMSSGASCSNPADWLRSARPTVQAMNRALLVDTLPASEQASGNAWAASMLGIGSLAGFFVYVAQFSSLSFTPTSQCSGNINLPSMFPFLGTQELQVLSAFASFLLLVVQCVTSSFVKEKVLVSSQYVSSAYVEPFGTLTPSAVKARVS
jgi:solute carrier family 45 protein 1/2/4